MDGMMKRWAGVALLVAAAGAALPCRGEAQGVVVQRLPPDRGLPRVSLWGGVYEGRHFSSLCVGCHTENPSAHFPVPVMPTGDVEPAYRGSHFVRHALGGTDRFTDMVAAERWEKRDAWSSGALSRYGDRANQVSITGAPGEMLCESCHDLVKNKGGRLLLEAYDGGEETALCRGCHADVTGESHHPLGAVDTSDRGGVRNPLPAAAATGGVAYFGTGDVVSCASCHLPHRAQTATGARVLRRGASKVPAALGGAVNAAYYEGLPATYLGSAVSYVVGDQVNYSRSTGSADPDAGGLLRQADYPSGERASWESGPLCDVCHKYND